MIRNQVAAQNTQFGVNLAALSGGEPTAVRRSAVAGSLNAWTAAQRGGINDALWAPGVAGKKRRSAA